ncbi:MAG: hypothetical protein ABEJ83_01395 [Candidatus Nanohaloarchaea archaeon]
MNSYKILGLIMLAALIYFPLSSTASSLFSPSLVEGNLSSDIPMPVLNTVYDSQNETVVVTVGRGEFLDQDFDMVTVKVGEKKLSWELGKKTENIVDEIKMTSSLDSQLDPGDTLIIKLDGSDKDNDGVKGVENGESIEIRFKAAEKPQSAKFYINIKDNRSVVL